MFQLLTIIGDGGKKFIFTFYKIKANQSVIPTIFVTRISINQSMIMKSWCLCSSFYTYLKIRCFTKTIIHNQLGWQTNGAQVKLWKFTLELIKIISLGLSSFRIMKLKFKLTRHFTYDHIRVWARAQVQLHKI